MTLACYQSFLLFKGRQSVALAAVLLSLTCTLSPAESQQGPDRKASELA